MTHLPHYSSALLLSIAALFLTACHGKGDNAAAADSVSFADTMTIDLHPENDQSVVDTSEPIPEPSHKEEATDAPAEEEAAPEASDTEAPDADAPATDAPAEDAAPAPAKGEKEQ